jgi:DNA-binding CsgD family transcriptional regulator/tetratricopeptide (TPR) repeat protein
MLEGEPGIGKTRVLLAIEEMARQQGFISVGVTTDEEIRGPFLLARSIFMAPEVHEAAAGTPAEEPVLRAQNALVNQDDPSLQSLAPDHKLLRIFDLAAMGLRALAAESPVAILVDDLQWADDDSLRLLRYVIRANSTSPIFLALSTRPHEMTQVSEAVTLAADLGRMGVVRHLKLSRFTQTESAEFLQQVLGDRIDPTSAAVMHAQAEGVPFILAEQAQAYREAGLIQEIDAVWTLARNAERLLPSAVKTLIQRRVARLPRETKDCLADAAVLGQSFSLRDLHEVRKRLGDTECEAPALADALSHAVTTGILIQHPDGSAADFSFTHGQIREYAASALSAPRRRVIHGVIVDMLTKGSPLSPESQRLIAQHAQAAGMGELCAKASIEAAAGALENHAPEEALKMVQQAQTVATLPSDRIALLRLQDDALDMLRRPEQRLEGLAELAALSDALRDPHLELEVMRRRAAALRLAGDREAAAKLAHRASELAVSRGDLEAELAGRLEEGQALLGAELGEGYVQTPTEADLDGTEQAFKRAAELAEQLGDAPNLAAATRELGIVAVSRVRAWFIEGIQGGAHIGILRRITAGENLETILAAQEIAPVVREAQEHFRRALEIYEQLGDRRGAMSTVIAIAFISYAPEIHLSGSVKRIEEIRRLITRMQSFITDSERARADAQMLFGSLVYSRAKGFPDAALEKGEEAYTAARGLGEKSLEFASAGGVALVHAELGDLEEAEKWLGRAAALASTAPTPFRGRRLESWRGIVRAAAGDANGMRLHLERAVRLASDQEVPSGRCEALARLALEAAQLGVDLKDEQLQLLAERSAREAKSIIGTLPGHPLWGAMADAALSIVFLGRGELDAATESGRHAIAALETAMREDLWLEILLPAANAVIEGGTREEAEQLRDRLRLTLGLIAQRILDEKIRVRWFRSPTGRELTRLAGPLTLSAAHESQPEGEPAGLSESDSNLLRLLTEGRTNDEIADELGISAEEVARLLAEVSAKVGASSRADATAFALSKKLV